MKKNAISLIVLVITILVMAILAATVIITLSNTNIINKANDVIEKNNKASEKEAINVAVAASYLEGKGTITTATLQKSMDEQFGSGSVEVEEAGNGAYTITMKGTSNNVYTIESDKTITDGKYDKWDGSSVEEPTIEGTNMKIAKASQLKWLSNQVNAGNLYEGYTITLDTNVDLGAREENGTWVTTANEAVKWSPIGDTKANTLKAKFDGQGHVVKGIYISGNALFSGFFGNSSSIYNLTVRDGYMQVGHCSGGIVGSLRSGEIVNCHNINVKVVGDGNYNNVGGIAGQAWDGTASVSGSNVNYTTLNMTAISNCTNTGDVTSGGYSVAGIVGSAMNTNISDCSNTGTITRTSENTTSSSNVGGIVGAIADKKGKEASTVERCYNSGNVIGATDYAGGLVGAIATEMSDTYKILIEDSYNSGSIRNTTGDKTGGVLGGIDNGTLDVVNCYNTGSINGFQNVGGIVGQAGLNDKTTVVNISKSYNTGNVNGNDGVGGISGKGGIVTNSYNTGNITGKDSKYGTGGIVGTSGTEGVNISLCYNSGTVTAPGEVGGISGYLGAQGKSAKVSQCYSKGNIVATSTTNVGALVGNMGNDAAVTSSSFLSTVGVNTGIGAINDGGDLDAQNAGAKSTTADVKTYSEFITWIKSQN